MNYVRLIKISVCCLFVGVGLHSCSKTDQIATPKPSRKMAKVTGKPYESLTRGYHVYTRKCTECHEDRVPDVANYQQWTSKIQHMSAVAGLSEEEQADLMSYLEGFSDR